MNPELQRNLWLEVTLHRLLLVPGVIIAGAALIQAIDPSGAALNKLAIVGFLIVTMVWGARQAANSVLEEARAHTWDIQRMCALSPWSMTWGKLLGATAISWYASLCCLLIFFGSGTTAGYEHALVVIFVLAVAVLAQATALIGALAGLHRGNALQPRIANLLVLALLAVLLSNVTSMFSPQASVSWYSLDLQRLPFVALTAVLFAAWAVLGASRAMSKELKIGTWPGPWLAFAGFVAVFAAGFTDIEASPSIELARCLFATLTLIAIVQSYIAAFAYPSNPIQFRRIERAVGMGRWGHALEELPLWCVSAALALAAALISTALGTAPQFTNQRLDNLGPVSLAAALMMLRDLGLLTYFSMTIRSGRAETSTLVYIGILDGLVPALLPHVGLTSLAAWFWPPFFTAPLTAIGILSVHVAIALTLAVYAYRRLQARLNETTAG